MSGSDYPNLKKSEGLGGSVHEYGPSLEEIKEKHLKRQRWGPGKFEGPYGFRKQTFKRSFIDKNPKLFAGVFVGGFLTIFFGPMVYSWMIRPYFKPTLAELYESELRKQRWKEAGIWDSPFNVKRPKKD
eukprot:TRINITY_DN1420_c0_g1_i2.p1 TRINITY_DN1420_c0_g1~~TRINITY_DN1420_c0_g1_i2.p1  ORF type:complete len:129 (-),score=2.30 TRINITY_DN1420_c0_g1_i2:283-669(-)